FTSSTSTISNSIQPRLVSSQKINYSACNSSWFYGFFPSILLNKTVYDPFNHDSLFMGISNFIGIPIDNYDLYYQNSIAVLSPTGNIDKFLNYNTIIATNISGYHGNEDFIYIPIIYISSAAVNQFNRNIYISTPVLSTVSIFNSTTCSITGSIHVGSYPISITVDQKNGYVYVINKNSSNISVIDPTTEKVISSINVGSSPESSIYDPINNLIYVTNEGSNNISVINPTSNHVIKSIGVGNDPKQMLFIPQNNLIYVNYLNSTIISVINTTSNQIIKNIQMQSSIPSPSSNMVYCEKTKSIYTLDSLNNISVISTSSNNIVKSIFFKGFAYLNLDPSNITIVLSTRWGGYLEMFNLSTYSCSGYISDMNRHLYKSSFNIINSHFAFTYNSYSNTEFALAVLGVTNSNGIINIYTFNVTNPTTYQAPINLFPIIVVISIVSLIAIVIIWRKSVAMKYKEYHG
ncbi:MAG: YncE family protein, partial [Thermoplasmataceae archaeon]